MVSIAYLIGNLNKEHGGAQKLLYDLTEKLPSDDYNPTVYYMFGEGTYTSDFEANGVDVIPLHGDGNADIQALQRLVEHLREDQPHILQTNSPISGVWGRVASIFSPVEHVVSIEHTIRGGLSREAQIANAATLPLTDVMVAVSDPVAESYPRVEKLLSRSVKKRTIYNGVNVADIQSKINSTRGTNVEMLHDHHGDIIGTVGRLAEAKGLEYLLEAAPFILDERPDTKFVIVGDGPNRESLELLADDKDLSDAVEFVGYQANPYPWMAAFTVGVYPSRWEGMPLAPLETIAAGTPVVGSNIEIFNEILGSRGISVNPHNTEEFTHTLVRLLEDYAKQEEYTNYLQNRVEAEYSAAATAESYQQLYQGLISD